jgi:hypothetical protein
MQIEPSWFVSLFSGIVTAFFGFKIKQHADEQRETRSRIEELSQDNVLQESKIEKFIRIEEELLQLRHSVTVLESTAITEARAREIANEQLKPLYDGQDEIKQDVKELLREFSNLNQTFTEVRIAASVGRT